MDKLVRLQDLPPPGGYKPIPCVRMPAKQYFRGITMFAAWLGISAGSFAIYLQTVYKLKRLEVEMRSATLAMTPLLYAERDREFLKQCYRNREDEAKLMANVPGWKVGTWYGEPIYKTKSKDEWVKPNVNDYYAQTDMDSFEKYDNIRHWM